jgi:hypothetical protein
MYWKQKWESRIFHNVAAMITSGILKTFKSYKNDNNEIKITASLAH